MNQRKLCPVCQKSNACALAEESEATDCWCMNVKINPVILPSLTVDQKNISCLCPKCADPLQTQ